MGLFNNILKRANRYIESSTGRGVSVQKNDIPDDIYFESLVWYNGKEEDLLQFYQSNNKSVTNSLKFTLKAELFSTCSHNS